MSNVIAFLESIGRDPALKPGEEAFTAAVQASGLDDQAQAALLARDGGTLSELLGGRTKMLCSLFPADEDDKRDEEQPDEDDQPDDKSPSVGLN
jgi:hypothetical protein